MSTTRMRISLVLAGAAMCVVWGGLWLTLRPVCEIDNRAHELEDREANDYVAALRDDLLERIHNPDGFELLHATVTTDISRNWDIEIAAEYRSGNQTGGVTRFHAFATLDRTGQVIRLLHVPPQDGVDFSVRRR